MIFKNRVEAGKKLAEKLKKYKNPIILSIPRGGVVIGHEIAKDLNCKHDVIIARKLGAPSNPELAIGAVTAEGDLYLDETLIEKMGVDHKYILGEQERQMKEAERREETYRGGRKKIKIQGKTVIVIDDGLATGATMEAAVRSVNRSGAKEVVVAVPVAPADTEERYRKLGIDIVVLYSPESFWAIGQFYEDFPQVTDEEVIKILGGANRNSP